MAYDPATGKTVLFGGFDGAFHEETWTFDGSEWTQQSTAHSPPARAFAEMAYDPAIGKMVLFGGCCANAETWLYDGSDWTHVPTAQSPPAGWWASMAFDPATGKMVLFGGKKSLTVESEETWTFDGSEWTQQSTAHSPPARHDAAMAFDPATGRMVLFGGEGGSGLLTDTWTYDGSDWTQQSTAHVPSPDASMVFDPLIGKVVLVGGSGGYAWTYDGSDWTQQSSASAPSARFAAGVAFDASTGKLIVFGGNSLSGGPTYLGDTWTYGVPSALPGEWIKKTPATSPPALNGAAMAFDPATGETVLFGGRNANTYFGKTWIYDGEHWMEKNVAQSPSPRWSSAMAFDPAIGKIVLFGGADTNGYLNETWVYEGETWKKLSPPTSPTPRYSASMAYDPAIGRMVLFGGYREFEPLEETWTFDGTTWTLANPTTHPSGRPGAGMDFDPQAGRMTLFGGQNPNTGVYPNETWTYKDANWAVQSTVTSPPGRRELSMVFDPAIGKMVMFGGAGNPAMLGDTWTYDEGNWTKESPLQSPSPRFRAPSTFDEATGQMVLFGGSESTFYSDTWVYQQVKATPTISTTPRTGVTVGATISDEATVSGRVEPQAGAEVEFKLYPPSDATCAGPPVYSNSVSYASSGEPAVSSGPYTTTEAGTYHWTATYTGDANNEAVSSVCTEDSTVNKASPTISTNPSRATLGGAIHDEATVEGRVEPQAGAEVEFKLYPPSDATCAGPPVYSNSVSYASSGEPAVSSGPYTTTEAGTYHWTAVYSGDENNEGAESVCEAPHAVPNEVLVGSIASSEVQPIDIATNTDGSTITVGSAPEQLAVSPDQETAYVANHGSNTVSVIDTATNAVTATITGFSGPEGVAFDPAGAVAYVANEAGGSVSVVDTTTNAITATIPVGSNPWQIAFTPDGSTAYVTNSGDDTVSVIDVSSGTVAATITGFDNPKGVVVTPDGKTVYVANDFGSSSEQGTVTPIATATNVPGSPIAVPATPIALATTPDGSEVLVASHFRGSPSGSTVTPIDTADNTPRTPYLPCFNFGNFGAPLGIAVTPDGQKIYTDNENNFAACYDSTTSPTPTAPNETYADSPVGIAIAAPMRIGNAATLPAPTVEESYSQALWSVNGTYPMTYSVSSGSLPPGVSLSSSGVLSGTPTAAGSYSFTVQSSDSSSVQQSTAKTFDLEVKKAEPTIATTPGGPVTVGATLEDEAKVEGRVDPQAGATVQFELYPPSDNTCANAPVYTHSVTYPGTGEPEVSSGPYTTTEAGAYHWSAIYSGDANNEEASSLCTEASSAAKASPTISTNASPDITIGAKLKDTATLAAGYDPAGTITFKLYGPGDATCAAAPAYTSPTVAVSGNGAYESPEFTPTEAGAYRWVASYSGDSNNEAAAGSCGDTGESVSVEKAEPTIATTPGGPVTVGATLEDEAKVEGRVDPQAGATVQFELYPPSDNTCANAPVYTHSVTYPGTGEPEVSSGPYTTTEAGAYHWSAIYSGDANNEEASSLCTEASSAAKASPTISTNASPDITIGAKLKDTATLAAGYDPAGTITFKLYGPGDATCAAAPAYTSPTVAVSGNGAYESPEFTPTEAGAYRWVASYSGDSNNEAAAGSCGDTGESVSVEKAEPTIATTPGGPVTVGATLEDEAKVEGRVDPQAGATVQFELYPPSDNTCANAPVYTHSVTYPGTGEPEVSSGPYTTTEAGAYHWSAIYSGDANNEEASSLCTEASSAAKASPTISTNASPDITIGAKLKDTATLAAGYDPAGTITFKLYGPGDATCAAAPAYTSPTVAVSGNGAYESPEFTPTEAGAYRWVASYSGDSNNEAAAGSCGDSNESVTVAKATPSISTTASGEIRLGASVTDKTTIAGAYSATGSVVFRLYGPNDPGCTGTPAFTSSAVAVSGNGDYGSPDFTPTKTGTYRWVVSYSGDANNEAVAGHCGDANESVEVAPAICEAVQSQVGNYVPKQTVTGAVPGVRVRLRVPVPSEQEVGATLHFRLNGKSHSVDLGAYAFTNPGSRNFHVPLPGSLGDHLPYGTKVTLTLKIATAPRASRGCIDPTVSHRKLHTRVVRVLAAQ